MQPTNDNLMESPTDIVRQGDVRPAIASQFSSSAESQTRLFWG
jgi:hypothetical protein